MNVEQNQNSPASKNCTSCKTFFGTQATNWLCSSCFKKQNNVTAVKPLEAPKVVVEPVVPKVESAAETPAPQPEVAVKPVDKSRCFSCNKKVGLMGYECKCAMTFCNLHRLPEEHQCNVDYRKLGQQKLAKQNTKVAPSKITQI